MKASLIFGSDGQTSVLLIGETPAEQAILAYMAEGVKEWRADLPYPYRPGGIPRLQLNEQPPAPEAGAGREE